MLRDGLSCRTQGCNRRLNDLHSRKSMNVAAGEAGYNFKIVVVSNAHLKVLSDLLALANMHVWLPLSENLADDVPINQSKCTRVYCLH